MIRWCSLVRENVIYQVRLIVRNKDKIEDRRTRLVVISVKMSGAINSGRAERETEIVSDVNNEVTVSRLVREVAFPVFGATVEVAPHIHAPWQARRNAKKEVSCVTSVIRIDIKKENWT